MQEALGLGGQEITGPTHHIPLVLSEGEKFKSVIEAVAVPNDGSYFDGLYGDGQSKFHADDLAGREFPGERSANAILTQFF